MSDLISRALLCGLGLASLSKQAVTKTVEDLVDQSKISEAEGRRLVKDWQRRSTEAQKALEKKVETNVKKVLKHLNLALRSDRPKGARDGAAKGRRRRNATKARNP